LLLDESTAALDADTRGQIVQQLLTEFKKERIALFVTHDESVIAKVDHVLDMAELNNLGKFNKQDAPLGRLRVEVPGQR
jgi:ABC-type transport system involved in cytochrome bd biosynthesis fused ATPase/permease subunit